MLQIIKKIYTILVLIKNVLFRHKHYTLHFVAEKDDPIKLWYYDFKHWGFNRNNLLMVSGADTLCELYANGKNETTVHIIASRKKCNKCLNYDHYVAKQTPNNFNWLDKIVYGRNYEEDIKRWKKSSSHAKPRKFWICPVTLFVLGRYPKYIYIKHE